MTDIVLMQQRLTEAQTAQHLLMLGQQVVRLRDSNGEEIQYSQTSALALAKYIASLEAQIALATGQPYGGRPMRAWMGP